MALGLLSENPSGGLQSTPRAKIEFSRDRPRAQIHLATPSACPQIFPLCHYVLETRARAAIAAAVVEVEPELIQVKTTWMNHII